MQSIILKTFFVLTIFISLSIGNAEKNKAQNTDTDHNNTLENKNITNTNSGDNNVPTTTKPWNTVIVTANDDKDAKAEEIFTYQVKRQHSQWPITPFMYGFPKVDGNSNSPNSYNKQLPNEDIKTLKSNFLTLEEKLTNLTRYSEVTEQYQRQREKVGNLQIQTLQNSVLELTRKQNTSEKLYNETNANTLNQMKILTSTLARKVDITQYGSLVDQMKPLILQVNALNHNFNLLRQLNEETARTANEKTQILEDKLEKLSRYAESLEHLNKERYSNGTNAVGQISVKFQNLNGSLEKLGKELMHDERIMESLQDNLHTTNEKISEIQYAGGEHWQVQNNKCGGILIAQAGLISYKFQQPYRNDEHCVWTIRANRKKLILVKLLDDGLQNKSNTDFISISHFPDGHAELLTTITKIGTGDRSEYTFEGPVIFISFQSDSKIQGSGFVLRFEGTGNFSSPDDINAIKYSHFHLNQSSGLMSYPAEQDILYGRNELTTIVINPSTAESRKDVFVTPRFVDLETEANCQYDSVNFYKSSMGSLSLMKRYCSQDTSLQDAIEKSPDGVYIVTFASDNTGVFKGFKFSWAKKNV